MARIAILNGCVVTMDAERRVIDGGSVIVEGGAIAAVGHMGTGRTAGLGDDVVDATGCAVVPGLVNAHTHLYHTFGRTLGHHQPFPEWLARQRGLVNAMTAAEFEACIELGLLDNLRSGNTCILDNLAVPGRHAARWNDLAIAAADRLGARYVLARGYTDQHVSPEYVETPEEIETRLRALVKDHSGRAHGRIRIFASPVLPWGVSRETYLLTRRLADDLDLGIHMHTAETSGYADLIQKAYGHRSHTKVLRDGECLGPRVQLLGCNFLTTDDVDTVISTGTRVVFDPTCSLFMGRRIPPMRRLLASGVPIGLGTNGAAGSGSQDMFECMKTSAGLATLAEDGGPALGQPRALEMATIEGARALGLDDAIGSIEPGKRADLVVVDLRRPWLAPALNVVAALVSSCTGRDVRDVFVDGRTVVRDGKLVTADERALTARAIEAASRCAARAGVVEQR